MSSSFNLTERAWIKTNSGERSLRELFAAGGEIKALSGDPVEKISTLKLALAIAQSALRGQLKNNDDWQALSLSKLSAQVLTYLDKYGQEFDLYGEHPFLQIKKLKEIAKNPGKTPGTFQVEISTGNTTVFTQSQRERPLNDAEKARLLISQMSFALSGKKTDHTMVLSPGYEKGKSACSGPAVGMYGALHCFYKGENFLETVRYNLLTDEDLQALNIYPEGLGYAPWERMPQGEDDEIARVLRGSYIGRLVSMCRFCLYDSETLLVTEGIRPLTVKEKVFDPSVTTFVTKKEELSLIYCDPEYRPWRQLTSLLSFMDEKRREGCRQLALPSKRVFKEGRAVKVWTGGLRITFQSGEQYAAGKDDYVESEFTIPPEFYASLAYGALCREMEVLDGINKVLYASVREYYEKQKVQMPKKSSSPSRPRAATREFWLKCERYADELTDCVCSESEESQQRIAELRVKFTSFAREIFDRTCQQTTARQIAAWAEARPHLSKFLRQDGQAKNG